MQRLHNSKNRCIQPETKPSQPQGKPSYYDKKLENVRFADEKHDKVVKMYQRVPLDYVRLMDVWATFGQKFIDRFVHRQPTVHPSIRQKLLAPPSLNPADFPCYPGALVIQRESTMQTTLLRRPRKAFIVGMVYDFIPPGINLSPQFRTETRQCNPGKHQCVFRGRRTDRSAIITASGLHWIELNLAAHGSRETRDVLETTDLRIYMGNFEYTGINHQKCYVINRVLMATNVKLEFTVDGNVYYESTFDAPFPLGYHALKVQTRGFPVGEIKAVSRVTRTPKIELQGKTLIERFIAPFVPNQARWEKEFGDYPVAIKWTEPSARQSIRPNYLSRDGRVQGDVCHYFDTEHEYHSLMDSLGLKKLQSDKVNWAKVFGEDPPTAVDVGEGDDISSMTDDHSSELASVDDFSEDDEIHAGIDADSGVENEEE